MKLRHRINGKYISEKLYGMGYKTGKECPLVRGEPISKYNPSFLTSSYFATHTITH